MTALTEALIAYTKSRTEEQSGLHVRRSLFTF